MCASLSVELNPPTITALKTYQQVSWHSRGADAQGPDRCTLSCFRGFKGL